MIKKVRGDWAWGWSHLRLRGCGRRGEAVPTRGGWGGVRVKYQLLQLQEENQQQKHGEWLVNFQLLKCTGSRKDVCRKYMPSLPAHRTKRRFFLLWAGFQLSSCSPWRLSILSSRKNQRGATGVGAERTWLEPCHQALSERKTCERTLWLFVGSNGWRLLLRQQRVLSLPFQAGIWYSSSFLHLWAPRQVKALWHRDATSISWSLEGWWHSMKPHSYLQETVLLIIRICTSCGVHKTVGFQWLEKNPKFSSVRQDTVFSSRSHLRELDFLMRKLPPRGICGWICGSRSSLQVFQHRSPSLSPACAVEWKGQLQLVVQRCFDSRGLMPMVQDSHCWWGLVSKWCKFLIRKSWHWTSCSKWCKLRLREV